MYQQNPYDSQLNEAKKRLEEIKRNLGGSQIVFNNQNIIQSLSVLSQKIQSCYQKMQALPQYNISQQISFLASELERAKYDIDTIIGQLRQLANNIQNLESEKQRLESEIPNLERQSKMWVEQQTRQQKDQASGGSQRWGGGFF